MKKFVNYSFLILAVGLLFQGCVQKVALTPEIKKSIDTIEVDNNVMAPKLPFFMTKGDALSIGLFGAIGGAAVASDMSEEERLKAYLDKNNIDIKKIYNDTLVKQLKDSKVLKNKVVKEKANFRLKSYINLYGLVYHHSIFSSDYKPTINVKMELLDKNNKIVWSSTEFISSYNDTTPREELEKYFIDKELMHRALTKVTDEVLTLLLEELI